VAAKVVLHRNSSTPGQLYLATPFEEAPEYYCFEQAVVYY
jgi:hypothetical protein